MNPIQEPFLFALDRWWQISLTVLGCVLSIRLAYYFGLNRPWPLPVILGGIQAYMIMEAYPYAWTLGPHTGTVLWVFMACLIYGLAQLEARNPAIPSQTIWDYFEEVDSLQKGV